MKSTLFTKIKSKCNTVLTTACLALVLPATAIAAKPDRSQLKGFGDYSTSEPIDQTMWKIMGAIGLLVGMAMAAYVLYAVAGALIGEFQELRSGKQGFGKLLMLLVVGIGVIIFVYYLITRALDTFGV